MICKECGKAYKLSRCGNMYFCSIGCRINNMIGFEIEEKKEISLDEIEEGSVIIEFKDNSFCFTGFRDNVLEDKIRELGGSVKNSVVYGLSYLAAKDKDSNSGKIKKAREYGVPIISKEELINALNGKEYQVVRENRMPKYKPGSVYVGAERDMKERNKKELEKNYDPPRRKIILDED